MLVENSFSLFTEHFTQAVRNTLTKSEAPLVMMEGEESDKLQRFIPFVAGLVLINILLGIWSNYDHALPVYDMACHLLSSFDFADLLAHAHPAHRYWWQALLAVNPLYPPFVYFVYGVFKLAFGPARWVELLVQHLFSSLLFTSMYGLGKTIFNSRRIALLSALLIFTFPTVFILTHYDMLDIPALSMVSLCLLAFIYWQKNPSSLSSIALGSTCALTALTKNNSIAFLVAPVLVSFLQSLVMRDWHKVKHFFLIAIAATVVMLPWLLCACRTMLKTVATFQNVDYHVGFIHHIVFYLTNLPSITSYFIFVIFTLAICGANKTIHRQMLYINASAIGGVFILSLFRWTEQTRYALPATIPMALYCAWAFVNHWSKPKTRQLSLVAGAIIVLAFIQNNFTPYPLPRFMIPQAVASFFGIEPARSDAHHAAGGASYYPTPPSDWGCEWTFNTIKATLAKSNLNISKIPLQQLAIMPDSEEVSCTSYAYIARRDKLPLHPFSPRVYRLIGAEFTFNPEIAKTVDWYLLKTGSPVSPASHFYNKESELAYKKWCDFVRYSRLFKLVGSKTLPDNTQLELYKKR